MNITIYDQNIWGGFPDSHAIANRHHLIKELIDSYDADICFFQECHAMTSRTARMDFHKHIPLPEIIFDKYEEVPTNRGDHNSTPIFYRRDRFKVIESGYHYFTGYNDLPSKSLTYAVLKDKESGVAFGALSTHFWHAGLGEAHDEQRLRNAHELMAYVNMLKEVFGIPVFVCGDLNCGEDRESPKPIEFLKSKMLDVRDIARETTYEKTCRDKGPARSDDGLYHGDPVDPYTETIDYAFVSESERVTVHSFGIDKSTLAYNSSDHAPLIIKAEIREN